MIQICLFSDHFFGNGDYGLDFGATFEGVISLHLGELLFDQFESECLHHFILQSVVLAVVCLCVQSEFVIHKLEQPVEVHVQFEEQLHSHVDYPVFFARNRTFCAEVLTGEVELTWAQNEIGVQ